MAQISLIFVFFFSAEKHDESDVLIEKFNIYLDQQCLNGTILIEYGSYQCSPAGHCYNITNVSKILSLFETFKTILRFFKSKVTTLYYKN